MSFSIRRVGLQHLAAAVSPVGLALGFAVCLMGCSNPDYNSAAARHARNADIANQGALADEAAARSSIEHGDQLAAQEEQESATQFRNTYRFEHFQAEKDRWLGEWWPPLPY